ncbi:unnamed protein product [Brassica oleracea var. botrytis]
MAVIISTNCFVNASFFDERWNSHRRLVFPQAWFNGRRLYPLKSKKNVIFCLNLNAKEVSEFKPSFDQYLQIMESVKTAQKKKKVDGLVIDKGEDDGENGDRRVKLGRDVEDVKTKDEGFRRRQEMVSGDDERGFKGDEESRIHRDVKWSKSGESSSVTAPEDESFNRRKYVKQEIVKYQCSPDASRGTERGFKADAVGERRFQRTAKDVKWSKSGGSSSVTVPEDESFKRRYVKQELVTYQCSLMHLEESSSDLESRMLPDTYTFNTMLEACAEHKKWDDFGYAYREMLHHGYHFNAKRHLKMVLEASRAGHEEVMEATWEHLRRSNRIPPSPLIKERFCRKLEKGDHVTAISSLAVLNGKIEETELRAWSTDAW